VGFQGVLLPPAIQVVDEAPLDPLVISGQGRAVSSPGSGHMAGESPGCLQAGAQSGDNAGRGERVEGAGRVSRCEPAGADGPVSILYSRWREIRACNDNACGESKRQNFHDRLLDLTFLSAAIDPKAPIY
jgi:hypothetical protein